MRDWGLATADWPLGFCQTRTAKLGKTLEVLQHGMSANTCNHRTKQNEAVQNLGGFATKKHFCAEVAKVQNSAHGGTTEFPIPPKIYRLQRRAPRPTRRPGTTGRVFGIFLIVSRSETVLALFRSRYSSRSLVFCLLPEEPEHTVFR